MAQTQEQILGAIRPTLFIGLGGTGKEVLLRLRRKFYERLGRPGLPCTAYLWADTDTRDVMAQGERMDEIYQAVTFQPHEQITLLEGKVGTNLSGMFTNRGEWEHIHNWLHPEVERFGTEISDGAGGVRTVGRLTFFYNFGNRINNLIPDALNSINTQQAINATKQLFQDRRMGTVELIPEPQVFIVCSLAGGTGCGTVLDTVFYLRYLSQQAGIPIERFVGILFMPNVFYTTAKDEVAQRSYGNAYAALKELEFYTLRLKQDEDQSIDYHVEWNGGHPLQIQGPPFSIAYIEEMKNEGGIGLDPNRRDEIFSMVAESLLLDFMPGPFSTQKRSHYSNVVQYLSGVHGANISSGGVVLPQEFARRYASFGMSKIEIPLDALKGAAAARLASEIAAYINRDTEDPHIMTNVLDDMAQRQLDAHGLENRYGTAWKESIRTALAAIFRGLTIRDRSQVDELETSLKAFEDQYINTRGTDSTKWGVAIDLIRKSSGRVSQDVNNTLLEWLSSSLDNDARGLRAVLGDSGYLRYMTENLRALYTPLREGVSPTYDEWQRAAEADADAYEARKNVALRDLREAISSLGVAGLAAREWTIRKLLERLHEAEEQYALARAATVLYQETKRIAESGVRFLSQKRPEMDKFQESIATLVKSFENKYREFVSFSEQVLFIRFFDYEKDWGTFYKLDVDINEQSMEVNPSAEYRRFLERNFGGNATLTDLIDIHPRQGEKEIRRLLAEFSENRFWNDFEAHPRNIDVLKHSQMNDKWNESIERMVRSAMPMIRRETHLSGRPLQIQRRAYLGVFKDEGQPYERFIEEVRRRLMGIGFTEQEINVQPTDKPWEVYLYLVTYAFPLSALPIVTTDCHKAYFDFYQALRNAQITNRKYQIPLHLSEAWEGKFEDLMVYKDDEARRVKESREILLFGAILKILGLTEARGRVLYNYRLGAPSFRVVTIGPKREAIEVLRNDNALRPRFIEAINQRETSLSKEDLEAYYWTIQYLRFSNQFTVGSPELTLLEEKNNDIYGRLTGPNRVAAETLDLEGGKDDERAERAKKKLKNKVEWVGDLPVLAGMESWKKPTGG
ncbi:MAG TPA: tubulin-like doman-containing protein [Pyrinomonadaceae bacterium]|jgi:hypothetical protein